MLVCVSLVRVSSSYLSSKHVPYVTPQILERAQVFLPDGPNARLTVELARRFRRQSRKDVELRMVVLGTLRAHGTNGGEIPLAGVAVLLTAFTLVLSLVHDWVISVAGPAAALLVVVPAIGFAGASLHLVRLAFAAHTRRVMATTWLAAYEDALAARRP